MNAPAAKYTPTVKRIAEEVRKLTIGEMIALREALARDFDLPEPPASWDREPRNPRTPTLSGGAEAEIPPR